MFVEQVEPIQLDRHSMKNLNKSNKELFSSETGLAMAPYGILKEPLKNLQRLLSKLEDYRAMVKVAQEAISLCEKGQRQLRDENWKDAWLSFKTLRDDLVQLGDESTLPWVGKQLAELKSKVSPEQRQASSGFPWWGWALIGCGSAGLLILGYWLFSVKRGNQKGKDPGS